MSWFMAFPWWKRMLLILAGLLNVLLWTTGFSGMQFDSHKIASQGRSDYSAHVLAEKLTPRAGATIIPNIDQNAAIASANRKWDEAHKRSQALKASSLLVWLFQFLIVCPAFILGLTTASLAGATYQFVDRWLRSDVSRFVSMPLMFVLSNMILTAIIVGGALLLPAAACIAGFLHLIGG